MSTHSQEIVHQVRQEFEALLAFVLKASPTPDADSMERSLFHRLFELGRLLLCLYFVQQDQLLAPEAVTGKDGSLLRFHANLERSYLSIFGQARFSRRYYYRKSEGCFPLDAALNLPEDGASDMLREWREKLCAYLPYPQSKKILAELLRHGVSTRELQADITEDAVLVRDYYAQAPKPAPVPEATILVVQADGKGVPLKETTPAAQKARKGKGEKSSRKKEALVTSVYTLAPSVRTPQEVVESLFEGKQATVERASPQNKQVFATLEGKEAALRFTAQQVWKQQGAHIRHQVALTDGSAALQERMLAQFPDFTLILDCIHAIEYLWKAANALLGETAPERMSWVKSRALRMLSGQTQALIAELQEIATTVEATVCKTLLSVAGYFARNLPYMRYDHYLAEGYPIATGVIEGACRHLVKDRCELSGMRWTQGGAEAMLQIRAVAENGDWEVFHAFRRGQRLAARYDRVTQQKGKNDVRVAA